MAVTLAGYAALFNVEAVIAGLFRERIAPGAFREALKRDDVRALFNHSNDIVLGRTSARTLTLREDTRGLRCEIDVNERDAVAMGLVASIEWRDITGSSFQFAIDDADDEEWSLPDRNKLPLRTLKRLRLIDVSPVAFPAYQETSVNARTTVFDGHVALEHARMDLEIAKAKTWSFGR